MRLLSIEIENFLSIERAKIDFESTGLLLIEGWNHDVDRANGAGKTAILNAISFGLYEKLPRKITASEIVRRGAKKGLVIVRIECNGEILSVHRSRPKGVRFFRETEEVQEELTITQTEFENKLKLTYNQFVVSMYCSQGNSGSGPRFLLLNDADKKQFLLQLLNLDEFSQCKRVVDERIQTLNSEIQSLRNQVTVLTSKMDIYSESLIDEDVYRHNLAKKEETRTTFISALSKYADISRPDLSKYQNVEEGIKAKQTQFTTLKTKREIFHSRWNQLQSVQSKTVALSKTCTTCGTKLDNSKAHLLHEEEKQRIHLECLDLKSKMDEIDLLLTEEPRVLNLLSKLKEKKRQESLEWERASLDSIEIKSKIAALTVEIESIIKALEENNLILEKMKKINSQREAIQEQIIALNNKVEIQKTVTAIFAPTGAQAYVLDSAVALFNEYIETYVTALWPNLTYELLSYKETVKGDTTAKFSERIVMDGRNISLGSLSGGELKALSICADMALLKILEQQFGIHMSPIIFDEAFDGLDASGKEFALNLIKELAEDRLVVVIDHASEMRATFDKILRVEKRNGISTISEIV